MTHFVDRLLIHRQMCVGFTQLRLSCRIGTLPEEQKSAQEILVSLKVALAAVSYPATDAIESTLDYTLLAHLCEEMALAHPHHLLETLAREILEEVFIRFSPAHVWIRIEKPAALARAECAYVEYEKAGARCTGL